MKAMLQSKRFKIKIILSMALSLPIFTAYSADIHHGHGGNWRDHNYQGRAYNHGRGGWSFGGGWGGPNVIIQVPSSPYYEPLPPICDRVEVCNSYGDCWIERRCQ